MNFNAKSYVAAFEVPGELANELSELLIREEILQTSVDHLFSQNDENWTNAMDELAKTKARIKAIKNKVTDDFVPDAYKDPRYVWNYDGTGVVFQIYDTVE